MSKFSLHHKTHNCSGTPHHHSIMLIKFLYALLIISSFPFSLCEIRNTYILHDSRPMILFERFGFAKGGRVDISVNGASWRSNSKAQPNLSSMGFFLASDLSFRGIAYDESTFADPFCVLSSPYVKLLFKFDVLALNSNHSSSMSIDHPDEYSLLFGNCQPGSEVSMYVHTEMYNLRDGTKDFLPWGQTMLPKLYFTFFVIYSCFFVLWVLTCLKQRPNVDKIHLIMGALLLVKALKMICAAEDKSYVCKTGTPHGWDVAFYIFGLFKGIMLFTVIILIGTGWSFLKPYLQAREKNVLIVVIPLQVFENIAYVFISETGPATKDWMTWNQMFLVIDIVCCATVFVPIIWSIRSLREASRTDGKAARNLEKLNLFKQFYVVLVAYLYFTRVGVSSIGSFLSYRHEWITYTLGECASLAFYLYIFHNFKPREKNPYLVIDDEEETAAGKTLKEGGDDDDIF